MSDALSTPTVGEAANRVVVVAGEALMDLVLHADGSLSAHVGGGPFNAARTVGRLEQPVSYLGRISTDSFGAQLRLGLTIDGVSTDAVVPTEAPTTLALAEIDEDGVARYRFYTEGTSAPGLELQEAREALPPTFALHVGALALVLEPIAGTLEALIAAVDEHTLVSVDPNCRPSIIRDSDGYRSRLRRLLPRIDLLKVSEEDLEWLYPGSDPVAAARELMDAGPPLVLLTRGGDGATVLTRTRAADVPAPTVTVVDTIGAGDAFAGAFLARWRQQGLERGDLARFEEVVDTTRFACLVAAMTCARAGATSPRLAELPT
jgi:fructokinase